LPVTHRSDDWVVVAANDTSSGLAFQLAPGHRSGRADGGPAPVCGGGARGKSGVSQQLIMPLSRQTTGGLVRAALRLAGWSAALWLAAGLIPAASPASAARAPQRAPVAGARIQHVIEIMLENHTFDNLFPWLGATSAGHPVSAPPNEGDVQGGVINSRAAELRAMDFRPGRGYLMDRFTDPPFGVQAITTFGPGFDPDLQYLAGGYELAAATSSRWSARPGPTSSWR
jgi:hypothetical protein